MEECHKQIQEATGKQKEKVEELGAEIRKLKAMIGERWFDMKSMKSSGCGANVLIFYFSNFSQARNSHSISRDQEQGAGETVAQRRNRFKQ